MSGLVPQLALTWRGKRWRDDEMTTYEKITCDGCGADLSDKGPTALGYRLVLAAEYILTDKFSHGPPPIAGRFHFCDIKCLDQWCTRGGPPSIKPTAQREDR